MSKSAVDQRAFIKRCVCNGIKCGETLKMLQNSFGDQCISKTQAYEWYKAFQEGRTQLEDLRHTKRPQTAINERNIQKVKDLVEENPGVTVREIASSLKISIGSAHRILRESLGMKRALVAYSHPS